eukprot:m.605212 g.605212  ORF g.605212 m.605212 type:complete len:451 (+) comp58108_c1_seq3:2026-3378(+)
MLVLTLLLVAAAGVNASAFRVLFASCNNQHLHNPFWGHLEDRIVPNTIFVWLGDIVYADAELLGGLGAAPTSEASIRDAYQTMNSNADYQRFKQTGVPIFGVYDDHDFGANDADKNFPYKAASLRSLLDFLDEPPTSPRRLQEGAWQVQVFDEDGVRIRLILLDNRYHRDPMHRMFDVDSEPQDMLGEVQWAWLDAELSSRTADVNIIGSGLQVLPDDKWLAEAWHVFPGSQARLFALLRRTSTNGVVFLSGDVHNAEISHLTCDSMYPWYEYTSSGMTHAWMGIVLGTFSNWVASGGRRIGHLLLDRNVAEMDIVWNNSASFLESARVDLRVFGSDLRQQLSHSVAVQELQFGREVVSNDVEECSRAPLHAGLPPSCRRLLETCRPTMTLLEYLNTCVAMTSLFCWILFRLSLVFIAPVRIFWTRARPFRQLAIYFVFLSLFTYVVETF